MRLLFSISYNPTLKLHSGSQDGHQIEVAARAPDWGKTGLAQHRVHVREALKLLWQARRHDVLVLCTACVEMFVVARLRPWICPNTRIICFDPLMPRENSTIRRIAPWLRRIDHFACIRRGDIETLNRRFGVVRECCSFVPFPADAELQQVSTEEQDYIYSAGAAHRDWPTLMAALANLPYEALISAPGDVEVPPEAADRVRVLPAQSPEEGRRLMAKAKLVVLSFEDTDLPSGPLIVLDAMAMGKTVIASDVNGTRDYIDHGRTGVLVPPDSHHSLAIAIQELMGDDTTRVASGAAGREACINRFTSECMVKAIVDACESADAPSVAAN